MTNLYQNFYRCQGGQTKWPFYELRPGESISVVANPNVVSCVLMNIRRSRGWTISQKKTGTRIEVTRHE